MGYRDKSMESTLQRLTNPREPNWVRRFWGGAAMPFPFPQGPSRPWHRFGLGDCLRKHCEIDNHLSEEPDDFWWSVYSKCISMAHQTYLILVNLAGLLAWALYTSFLSRAMTSQAAPTWRGLGLAHQAWTWARLRTFCSAGGRWRHGRRTDTFEQNVGRQCRKNQWESVY